MPQSDFVHVFWCIFDKSSANQSHVQTFDAMSVSFGILRVRRNERECNRANRMRADRVRERKTIAFWYRKQYNKILSK